MNIATNKKAIQILGAACVVVALLDLKTANDCEDGSPEETAFKLMGIGALLAGCGCLVLARTLDAPSTGLGGGNGYDDPIEPFDPAPGGTELPLMFDEEGLIEDLDPDAVATITDEALSQVMGEAEAEREAEEMAMSWSYGSGDDLA